MEDSNSMASTSSADDVKTTSIEATLVNVKPEKIDNPTEGPSFSQTVGFGNANPSNDIPRVKRQYNKKPKNLDGDSFPVDKPPPKKRGRKSKKELLLMDQEKSTSVGSDFTIPSMKSSKVKPSVDSKLSKSSRKGNVTRKKATASGPSVFDKRILAGPHLTMKQILDYIVTDHSYCFPPDPLPAVASNHQVIRYILGPKNGGKPRSSPTVGALDAGDMLSFPPISRARTKLSLTSTPPKVSKLENLLKRVDSSPSGRFSQSRSTPDSREDSDVEIDIVGVEPEPEKWVTYDVDKAKEVMNECEKYVEFANTEDIGDQFEEKIIRIGWTKSQNSLFDKALGVLHAERLARLTYSNVGDTEPVLRRASLDRSTSRMRRLFGEFMWDTKLTQWLHSVLTEVLSFAYLAIYMDILQTLKAQCPHLISRMMKLSIITPLIKTALTEENQLKELLSPYMSEKTSQESSKPTDDPQSLEESLPKAPAGSASSDKNVMEVDQDDSLAEKSCADNRASPIRFPMKHVGKQVKKAVMQLTSAKNAEAFRTLMERQWDPFSPDLMQRLKKLASNPIFLVIAPGAVSEKTSLSRRLKQYYRMFNRVGKVIKVRPNPRDLEEISPHAYLERIFAVARAKLREARRDYPTQSIYLVGWGAGSVLAAKLSISSASPVEGVIALGFPLQSLQEMHEEIGKVFATIKHPILFVIGGLASNNCLTDMELFRRKLTCETSLVVVGSGNENLYVCRDHREKLYVTQTYVDKTVMDEIAYFVNLHSKHGMVTGNFSMKHHHIAKSHGGFTGKKTPGVRSRKRKSSMAETDGESILPHNEDSRDSCDSEFDRMSDVGSVSSHYSGRRDSESSKSGFDFDPPKFSMSGKPANKRKSLGKTDLSSQYSVSTPSSSLTASKLLQQSPNIKRRMSKPSGPNQRHSMPNQPFPSTGPSVSSVDFSQASLLNDKDIKRKAAMKAKGPKQRHPSDQLPSSIGIPAGASMDLKNPLLQQMAQPQPSFMDRSHQSQLFKLLSPGADCPERLNVSTMGSSGLPTHVSADTVRLGLAGSLGAETRTTVISKQNLVGNMNLPLIRLSRPNDELLQQKPLFITGTPPTTTLGNLPVDSSEKILVQTPESGILKLSYDEITKLIHTGGLKLLTGTHQAPVNMFVTKPGEVTSVTRPLAPTSSTLLEPQTALLDSPAIIVPIKDLGLTQPLIENVANTDQSAVVETAIENKSAEPSVAVEPAAELESMETDADLEDEEMSGLLISSTFSVCPTSGERVDAKSLSPSSAATAALNTNNDALPSEVDAADAPKLTEPVGQTHSSGSSETVRADEPKETKQETDKPDSDKVEDKSQAIPTAPEPTTSISTPTKERTPRKKTIRTPAKSKKSETSGTTSARKAKQKGKKNDTPASDSSTKSKSNTPIIPDTEPSKDSVDTAPVVPPTESTKPEGDKPESPKCPPTEHDEREPPTLPSEPEVPQESEGAEKNLCKDMEVSLNSPGSPSSQASIKSDKSSNSDKSKSGATSTDKNNPVRRSARLKSGV